MENKSNSYSLVAWIKNGQVRMIPSLVNDMKAPYEDKLLGLRTQEYTNEVGWLITRSRSWEEYARFFLNIGYIKQAYQCYGNAALVCRYWSYAHWLHSRSCIASCPCTIDANGSSKRIPSSSMSTVAATWSVSTCSSP